MISNPYFPMPTCSTSTSLDEAIQQRMRDPFFEPFRKSLRCEDMPPVPLAHVQGWQEYLSAALHFARCIAQKVARQVIPAQHRVHAKAKQDGSLVTAFDMESDAALRQAITAHFPSHDCLSEEGGQTFRGAEWTWVIDPIDGTTNFTHGFPVWGVLVGLLHNGFPVLGVMDFPLLNEQYYAARGLGAWLNGAPIRVLTQDQAEAHPSSQLFACCSRTLKLGAWTLAAKARVAGTSAYDLASVARGVCLGSLDQSVHVWDVAAAVTILEEAGGCYKTNLRMPLFPLRPGVNYRDVSFAILAAHSQMALETLEQQLKGFFIPQVMVDQLT